MNNKIIISIIAVIFSLTLVGCGKQKDPLIGKWAQGSYVYTFNEDKTCSYEMSGAVKNCTYETNGDEISILYEGNTAPFKTTYSIDGNKLNVKDSLGKDTIYERK